MTAGLPRRMRMMWALLLVFAAVVIACSWALQAPTGPRVQRLVVQAHAAGVHIEEFPVSAAIPKPLPARLGGIHTAADPDSGINAHYRWPSFHAQARFDGPSVIVRLEDHHNRLRLKIDDGRSLDMVLTKPGATDLRIDGLAQGPHSIALQMLSEAAGESRFGGFFLPDGARALPPLAVNPRQILFIGDSDTVGYANTAQSRDCTSDEVFLTTDTTQSFPALLARSLDAEATVLARSGIGLIRNYAGADPGHAMADIYAAALGERQNAPEGQVEPPAIVVIGLGSNDFSGLSQGGDAFRGQEAFSQVFGDSLVSFLKDIHHKMPLAALVMLIFPKEDPAITVAYEAAAQKLRALGAIIKVVALPALDRQACHWHPSLTDHYHIAEALRPVILGLRPKWRGPA